MQTPFSLKLNLSGLSGPSPTLGSEGSTATGSFLQLGEKQLFEKFWKGTFKAVATPRPESVIVASITARRRVTGSETTTSYQPLQTDDRKAADMRVDSADRNGCIKGSGRKHHSHRRARIPSFDGVLSPRAKGKKKKKKRKSERKRKRRRSPSHSLSPARKKKKKKKKSTKKSKHHRYTSKKSKHSSSSLKRKRKDERKHKKSSRTHSSRRRRHYRRSESCASSSRSFPGDRHLQKSVVRQAFRAMGGAGEETRAALNPTEAKWRHASKSVCKTAPKYRSILSAGTILSLKPGSELLNGKGAQGFSSHAEGTRDYDSGNDTSSPPSSKTGVSRASVAENQRNCCQRLTSPPEKQRFADRDNGSDSGNSVTSYASSCKPYGEHGFSATVFSGNSKSGQITLGCEEEVVRCPKAARCAQRRSRSSRKRRKTQSSSSSRSRSSGTSRYSGRYSRSPSMSSCSSYSRSLSNSSDVRRRGSLVSLSSRGSYSKYSADRLRDRKRQSSSRETNLKHMHKVSGKRRRRKSYSPMRKRRRDSPSHLEARRITSARKRPIPYFRPSPSASSRSTSVSSWSSLFTRSRSRSHSRSRSCSRSYSSYRSYSRSSSWNSIFGSHSRSRSRGSLKKRRKARR
ncbi:serine/arginine repetitive matrix protein 4 [Xiphophorus maculatus]|uniref:Serine/arginine repetitive matrix 4 n=1 Tax=Xiphophorus maculatus TaxID=8083 RepID=M3ZKB5_XIPMA|nr:serine/arginine repetitive matrix protein 4 [Xiphophorus maculatus]